MNWSDIPEGPEDAVFKVTRLYKECANPQKVFLGIGAYRDENSNPLVLQAVIQAKADLAKLPDQSWTHEYQAIEGHGPFLSSAQELLFGRDLRTALGKRLVGLQSISGTGACRLICEFTRRFSSCNVLYIPNPTWANHRGIGTDAGLDVREYRYLDSSKPTMPQLDLHGLLQDLMEAPMGATVLLHMCAHNPTGVDPTPEQWQQIISVCKKRNLQPFIDNAYQGFASGDLDKDATSLRMFVTNGLCPMIACSFAKNMGLYGERVGVLHVVAPNEESASSALSQLKIIARRMYSNPPKFGAEVAHRVMTTYRSMWVPELKQMADRMNTMRKALRAHLEEKVKDRSWAHITDQIGMLSYSGLTKEQVEHCRDHGSVFMLNTGRMNIAGLNEKNVEYVADVISKAIEACPTTGENGGV